ncbi:MAG: T9SS type A sorting domain-containing protein [Bacteroidales bacterium]|nr:T9SS type A sorting domain-containing protein [Bacteroidales bacterium]
MKAIFFFLLTCCLSILRVSSQNPFIVHDIYSGPNDSYPQELTVFNNKLYFSATDGIHGMELYEYDGNQPPILYNLSNVNYGSFPSSFCVFNNKMYFSARDQLHGYELWSFDGINPPIMEYDIRQGYLSSGAKPLICFNNKLYLTCTDDYPHGAELWSFDGINPPELVYDINPGPGYSVIDYAVISNNKLYFKANNGVNGAQLWEYDGINNPQAVSNISSLNPRYLCAYNNNIYFCGSGEEGDELWVYDQSGQVSLLADIYPGASTFYDPTSGNYYTIPNSSSPRYFKVYNNKLYFAATDSISGNELWVYDGINDPTLVYDLFTGPEGSNPAYLAVYNDKLYFSAIVGTTYHYNLCAYDGISNPIIAGDTNNNAYYPFYLKQFNNKLYFSADDYSLFGRELWAYDDLSTSISSTSISQEFMIFPNPTSGLIEITLPMFDKENNEIEIYNLYGQAIANLTLRNTSLSKIEINLSDNSAGIYFVCIRGENRFKVIKIIKN